VALEDIRLQKIRNTGVVAVRRNGVDLVACVGTPDVCRRGFVGRIDNG